MEIIYYGYPKCTTCKKAEKWLTANGISYKEINIAEAPPTEVELRELINASELDIKKFFNVSGKVYREENLKDKLPTMTEDEKIQLLSSNGMLIKRPIVSGNGKVTVGFKEENFEEIWGNA